MIILETDRLQLRDMTMDDLDALHGIFSDAEMMRFYPEPFDRATTKGWIENMQQRTKRDGIALWTMVLKETGEVIGDCGLVVQEVDGEREVEIGWHVRRDLWGRGYATEAARACLHYGYDDLDRTRFISIIAPGNIASRRVAEKIGMTVERETVWRDRPVLIHAIDRERGER
jgi:[ribosomal protein S5]-alanine N-acetyltransferase